MTDKENQNPPRLTAIDLVALGNALQQREADRAEALAAIQRQAAADAQVLAAISGTLRDILSPDGRDGLSLPGLGALALPAATSAERTGEIEAIRDRLYADHPPVEVLFEHRPDLWETRDGSRFVAIVPALVELLVRVDGRGVSQSIIRPAIWGRLTGWQKQAQLSEQTYQSNRAGRPLMLGEADALRFLNALSAGRPEGKRSKKIAYVLRAELTSEEAALRLKKN